MRLRRACEAIERGCCLEIFYRDHTVTIEAHAAGFDALDHPVVLGCQRRMRDDDEEVTWLFLRLDEARKVSVSGYFSSTPCRGYRANDARFARICCQLE